MERVLHLQCGNMFDVKNINSADVVMMETDIPTGMNFCVFLCSVGLFASTFCMAYLLFLLPDQFKLSHGHRFRLPLRPNRTELLLSLNVCSFQYRPARAAAGSTKPDEARCQSIDLFRPAPHLAKQQRVIQVLHFFSSSG